MLSRTALLCVVLLSACGNHDKEIKELLRSAQATSNHGDLAEAEHSAERGMKIAESAGDTFMEWEFRLIFCEVSLKQKSPERALAELQKPLPAEPRFAVLAARRKMLEGQALLHRPNSTESEQALNTAHQLALDAHDVKTLIDVEILQGSQLLYQSRWEAAEETLSDALKAARAAKLHYEVAGVLVNLGMSRLRRHHYDEAISYFQEASAIDASQSSALYSVSQANLAVCYFSLGEIDRAIDIQLKSIAQHERTGDKVHLERVLGDTGNAYRQIGEGKKAVEYLERALNLAEEIDRNRDAAIWASDLAVVLSELGEWKKAEEFNDASIRIKMAEQAPSLVYNTLNSARIAVGRGQFSQAERQYHQAIAEYKDDPAVLWEAHSELGHSLVIQGKPAAALKEFEAAVTIVEQTRSDLLSTEYQLPFLTRLIRLYQSYVDALIGLGEYDRALAVADSSRAQTLADRFGSAPFRSRAAGEFKKVSGETGSTILTYWLGVQKSQAWVITPDGVEHAEIAGEAEIAKAVEEYNEAVQHRLVDPRRTHIPSGERLFHLLIEPVRRWIPAGSKIIIVPDGVLSGLNFETLPVPGAEPRYWIQDVTIAIAPSINVLSGAALGSVKGRGLLIIGDPNNVDPSYAPLTSAPTEIDHVARHYAPDLRVVLQKKDAVPQAYRNSNPSQFAAIHFTAHATANRDNPLDSAVLLTGGKLYARDVLEMPLHANVVTLSACRGMGSRAYTGEGLVGFAWAFLRAGARNVIAGLWDVNDQSTAELMDVTYRELSSGKKPAEALRTAKLALIDSKTNFRKPYYWGAFQVYTVDSFH